MPEISQPEGVLRCEMKLFPIDTNKHLAVCEDMDSGIIQKDPICAVRINLPFLPFSGLFILSQLNNCRMHFMSCIGVPLPGI